MNPQTPAAARPTIPAMRALLYVASFLVLTIGLVLYLLSNSTETYFAWTIAVPLTAAFLGGSYLTSFLLEFLSAREKIWANSRVAVPAVLIFTALTFIVTLTHLDRFHFNAPNWYTVVGTWVWFFVYASVPIVMTVTLVLQLRARNLFHPDHAPTAILPAPARIILLIQGTLLIVIGILYFLVPESVLTTWVWQLTPLTARAVGAWLIGLGIAAAHAGLENDWTRLRPLMISFVVFAHLQVIALLRYPDAAGLNWSSLNTWLYVAFLLSFFIIGIYGVIQSRKYTNA